MSTTQVLEELKHMSIHERLEVIETASRLVREELTSQDGLDRSSRRERMRKAAQAVKHLYEPGGELTEWTVLDGEDVLNDYVKG